jgi:PAS domain S-box-containing protein
MSIRRPTDRDPFWWGEVDAPPEFSSTVLDHLGQAVLIKDREFRWIALNRSLCELLARSRTELLGKTDFDFFEERQARRFRQQDEMLFAVGTPATIEEEQITDAQGRTHVLSTTQVPLHDEQGAVTHLVGIIQDITRLKQAEEALRTVNEQLELRVQQHTTQLREAQQALLQNERLVVLGQERRSTVPGIWCG